jgi:hypothetical protein
MEDAGSSMSSRYSRWNIVWQIVEQIVEVLLLVNG